MASILVMDDDRGTRSAVSALLEADGYTIVGSGGEREAQEAVQQHSDQITAIVLGSEVEGGNPLAALRWLKRHETLKNTPVVMLTDGSDVTRIHEGIEGGAFYYLTRPIEMRLLRSIVRAAVEDFTYKETLLKNLAGCQNPFGQLQKGQFRFKTLKEAERIALWISNACPVPARAMGVHEILINAVEHGNLGISYAEKSALLDDGKWSAEIDRRLKLPENLSKYVEVDIVRHPDRMTVRVEDQGPGFDFAQFLDFDEHRVFDNHGRGIALAGASLGLDYRGRGNEVVVTIPFEEAA